jgi:ankyrin repeat protein
MLVKSTSETKSTTPALFLQCSLTCFFSFDTPLLVCARNGHLKTCRLLLQCKADIEAKSVIGGYTPLHYATYNGHLEVCNLLLQAKANVEARDFGLQSPLTLAVIKGHLEICRLLLQTSKNWDRQLRSADSSGWTALHHAVRLNIGSVNTCRLLVESKADVAAIQRYITIPHVFFLFAQSVRCSDGKTALKVAIDLNRSEVVAFLRTVNAPDNGCSGSIVPLTRTIRKKFQ